jgi:transposase InsO family protein
MPWKAKDAMQLRVEFVVQAKQAYKPLAQLCREYGISRPMGYLWLRRYQEAASVTGLAERSRRPRHSPRRTSAELEALVVTLRERYGWGARKLQVLLAEQGHQLPEVTLNRILKRHGLVGCPSPAGQATQHFERAECNQLAQLDFKGEYALERGTCYPLSLLDDHSRYLLGLWPLSSPNGEAVQAALEGLFRAQGVPQALLLDHGTPWWSPSNGHGLTRLSVWLLQQGLRLLYSGLRHPQTQGKVERFHRTLKDRTRHRGLPGSFAEWQHWAPHFRQEYNERRPHEALGMRTPAQVYRPVNLRPYQEQPVTWDYGSACVRVLNSAGVLDYRGARYFVCEALAGERVRLDELDHLLLVTFRDTTVREINLRTGRTQAVVLSPHV